MPKKNTKKTSHSYSNDKLPDQLTTITEDEIHKALSSMANIFVGYPEIEKIYLKMKSDLME